MDVQGLVYLLNQAGKALAQAEHDVAQLKKENQELQAALVDKPKE